MLSCIKKDLRPKLIQGIHPQDSNRSKIVHTVCRAYCFPCIAPKQDLETIVQGSSLNSPAFHDALYMALRTLIDNLGMSTFNVGIMGMNAVDKAFRADFSTTESSQQHAQAGWPAVAVQAR